jgi:hypothetical protein
MEKVLSKNFIAKMQGRQIGDSTKHYSKHDILECLEQYKRGYHLITIESMSLSQKTSDEFKALRDEIKDMKQKIYILTGLTEDEKATDLLMQIFDRMDDAQKKAYLAELKKADKFSKEIS